MAKTNKGFWLINGEPIDLTLISETTREKYISELTEEGKKEYFKEMGIEEVEVEEGTTEKKKGNPAWQKKPKKWELRKGNVVAEKDRFTYENRFTNWFMYLQKQFEKKYNAGSDDYTGGSIKIHYPETLKRPDKDNLGKWRFPKQRDIPLKEVYTFLGDDKIPGDGRQYEVCFYETLIEQSNIGGVGTMKIPIINGKDRALAFKGEKVFGYLEKDMAFFFCVFSSKKYDERTNPSGCFVIENKKEQFRNIAESRRVEREISSVIWDDTNDDDIRWLAKGTGLPGVDSMIKVRGENQVRVELENFVNASEANRKTFYENRRLSPSLMCRAYIRQGLDTHVLETDPENPNTMMWYLWNEGKKDRKIAEQQVQSEKAEDFLYEIFMRDDSLLESLKKCLNIKV